MDPRQSSPQSPKPSQQLTESHPSLHSPVLDFDLGDLGLEDMSMFGELPDVDALEMDPPVAPAKPSENQHEKSAHDQASHQHGRTHEQMKHAALQHDLRNAHFVEASQQHHAVHHQHAARADECPPSRQGLHPQANSRKPSRRTLPSAFQDTSLPDTSMQPNPPQGMPGDQHADFDPLCGKRQTTEPHLARRQHFDCHGRVQSSKQGSMYGPGLHVAASSHPHMSQVKPAGAPGSTAQSTAMLNPHDKPVAYGRGAKEVPIKQHARQSHTGQQQACLLPTDAQVHAHPGCNMRYIKIEESWLSQT